MKRLTEQVETDDRADITPLIDVIFMLLLFFIITMTFAEETFFPIQLPSAAHASILTPADAAVVEITHDDKFALNGRPVMSRTRLYEQLRTLKNSGVKAVIIKADEMARAKHIAWMLDALRELKINEFSVTAQPAK